ncbi:MAG TPA: phosphoribosylamine--glycine ligase [Candidatus Paceibacterota bacterium]
MKNKVLLIGSGGREHALAWKLAQSPNLEKLFIAPGNAGTQEVGENVPIAATDLDRLVEFAKENQIDFVIVAPDDPIAMGLVDRLEAISIPAFGPHQAAAEIESSKVLAKQFMQKYDIPTAEFQVFKEFEPALTYVREKGAPIVIKASGLALGKGAFVCHTLAEAETNLRQIMVDKTLGPAGDQVVVEEFLDGPEISIHVLSDGKTYKMFPTAQDHKTIFENDQGPMTGGIGMIAPVPQFESPEFLERIEREIVQPTLEGLKTEDRTFQGLLYPGLKMTSKGPKVLEFNARFGDPEPQSYLRLLKSDLLEVLYACATGHLDKVNLEWSSGYAACIVLVSSGYPGKYEKGKKITGIAEAESLPDVKVFHAGTKIENNELVTNGGRVLGVTATGADLKEALDKAYAAVLKIKFEGMQYRKDIGAKSLK